MKKFDDKLDGFKKFKAEMSDGLFDLSSKTRGNQLATSGINTKGAGDTPIGELNRSYKNSTVGGNKGGNAGGPGFSPSATGAAVPTMGHSPTGGNPTGYRTNDGPMKNASDNVTNQVSRGIQKNTGAGINNQRSFGKQPGYGQKDMSHLDSSKRQKEINKMSITPKKKTFGGRFFGQEGGNKKQIGRKLETSELFGKTGEQN